MSVKRDYKSKKTWTDPQAQIRRQVRRRGLLVSVLLLVALLGSVFGYLSQDQRKSLAHQQADTGKQPGVAAKEMPPDGLPPQPKPKYQFYTLLPEQQLKVSKDDIDRRSSSKSPDPQSITPDVVSLTAQATTQGRSTEASKQYVIQAGSFTNYAEADRIKAQIALLGMRARIEAITNSDGKTFNRVRLGPFKDRNQAQIMNQQLQVNGIDAIAIKVN